MPACRRPRRGSSSWSALICAPLIGLLVLCGAATGEAAVVSGELRRWHRVEVSFAGPHHAETDDGPNPFLDYRLQCTFTGPSGQSYEVPGFFDAGGAGSGSGNLWKCRFAPDAVGAWQFVASFRQGNGVAVSLAPSAGSPAAFDGETGSFAVTASDKAPPDFRAPGRGHLVNAGAHYLQFRGGNAPWVKGGPDIPENFLGYVGFDNTPAAGHAFAVHVADWKAGDPDWGSGAGRAIVGALNYIAETGGNSIYFLPMNVGGDGNDTFPTVAAQDKTHYDTSKLAQWEIVLTHADRLGVFLHVVLSEAENANASYHDGGSLGPQRKLFYRELVARFAHHLGIEWDIGEENDYGTAKRKQFAAHLRALDAYDHPVTTHVKFGQHEQFYAPLLGDPDFAMTAIQDGPTNLGDKVVDWRRRSAAAGVPWVVSVDEPHPIQNDPDDQSGGYPSGRRNFIWPVYLSGGGGFEWYVKNDGGGDSFDQEIESFREMEVALRWTSYARAFLSRLPLLEMAPAPSLSTARYTLAAPGAVYAMYLPSGGSVSVDLTGSSDSFTVRWLDPETGAWHDGGSVGGGGWRALGSAPFSGDAAVIAAKDGATAPTTTVAVPSTTLVPPTTTTLPPPACSPQPIAQECRRAGLTVLLLRTRDRGRDKLRWTWLRGEDTSVADFGDPAVATAYELCVYDWSAGVAGLVADLRVPAGRGWRSTGAKGYRYAERSAQPDGVKSVKLRVGRAERVKIIVKAGDPELAVPTPAGRERLFEQEPRVTVDLLSSAGGCWRSEFSADQTGANRPDSFRAKHR